MSITPPDKYCRVALNIFETQAFGDWQGLPRDCKLNCIERLWQIMDAGVMLGSLGSKHHSTFYDYYRVPAYAQPVRVWHIRGTVKQIDVESPLPRQSAEALLDLLGAPELKSDARYGFASFPEGEWFYGQRGLSVLHFAQEAHIQAMSAFPPTTFADYEQHLRIERSARPMPRGER
jgi:hypothetical protein